MKTPIRCIFTFFLTIAASACQYKQEARLPNEPAVSNSKTGAELVSQKLAGDASALQSLNLKEIYTALSAAKNPAEMNQQLDKLEVYALGKDYVENSSVNRLEPMRLILQYYNFGLIRLQELKADAGQISIRLKKYTEILKSGCDENLKKCQNIEYFRMDHRSRRVILMMVEELDQKIGACTDSTCGQKIKEYYDNLALAFDVNNLTRDAEMEFLYIKRAREYGLLFKSGKDFAQNADFFHRHGLVFENIISHYPADQKSTRFSDFVKAFKPWNYSRLDADPFPFGIQKMFSFAASEFLYSSADNSLNPDFKAAIVSSQDQDDKAGRSFLHSLQDLQADQSSKAIFKNLNFNVDAYQDASGMSEYFFMIDRLYRGHLGREEVSSIWQGSKKDQKALSDTLNFYIRVEFIKMIVLTNKYMLGYLSQTDIPNDILFEQVIQKSESLTKQWGLMISQMDSVASFVSEQLKINGGKATKDSLNESLLLIANVKRNAKFLSVYPNMLLLGYFMIDLKADLKFSTWWGGEISINPKEVMNALLDGAIGSPWFVYSVDSSALSKTEIIYAYYYALNTGAFETFSVKKDAKNKNSLDRISFFKTALEKTMTEDVDVFTKTLEGLADKVSSNSNFASFMEACQNESENKQEYKVNMPLTSLEKFALFGSRSTGYLQSSGDFYMSGPMSSISEKDISLEKRLVQVKSMMKILKLNLKQNRDGGTLVDEQLKAVQATIDDIENLKKAFLKEVVIQHKKLSQCTNRLNWLERKRESALMTLEMQHLGGIWDQYDTKKLTGSEYVYSKFDFLKRFQGFSDTLKPKVIFEEPEVDAANNLKLKLIHIPLVNSVTGKPASREEFIADGMKKLSSKSAPMITWFDETASITPWQEKINTMAAIYRMQFESGIQADVENTISAKEIIADTFELAKFIQIQDDEIPWLKAMGLKDRIPRANLQGFFSTGLKSDYKGILDNVYSKMFELTADLPQDLDEAKKFYEATVSLGNFLFPPSVKVTNSIDNNYLFLVRRTENMINDFNQAIADFQTGIKASDLNITFRLDEAPYSPNLIDGGTSLLLDLKIQNNLKNKVLRFHNVNTNHHFKSDSTPKDED